MLGFSGGSDSRESACNVRDLGLIPGSERSPGEGNGDPLQYSCLGSPMDRGTWWATVRGIAKSQTWLSDSHTHIHTHTHTRMLGILQLVSLRACTHTHMYARHSARARARTHAHTHNAFCSLCTRTHTHTHTHTHTMHSAACVFAGLARMDCFNSLSCSICCSLFTMVTKEQL